MFVYNVRRMNKNNDDIEFVEEDGEGAEIAASNKIKKIREELGVCKKERDEHLAALQRARADYVNLKRDMEESGARSGKLAKEKLITDLLPILDAFDMAMGNKETWEQVDENWRKGIEYIHSQFHKVLEENGVSVVDDLKADFDPVKHEPLETIETDDKKLDQTIAEIIQKGYCIGDKVIRSAKIKLYQHS